MAQLRESRGDYAHQRVVQARRFSARMHRKRRVQRQSFRRGAHQRRPRSPPGHDRPISAVQGVRRVSPGEIFFQNARGAAPKAFPHGRGRRKQQ